MIPQVVTQSPPEPTQPKPPTDEPSKSQILQLDPAKIRVNRDQPRTRFDEEAIDELAQSIRSNGILQPLVVCPTETGYELIAGERRLRAARRLELAVVPAIIREATPPELLELALIENIQREDLNPVELALAYEALRDQHGWTQNQLADHVGKKRSTIANVLRFLELPDPIQRALAEGRISQGHAKVLLSAEGEEERLELFAAVVANGLSVRALEDFLTGTPEPTAALERTTPPTKAAPGPIPKAPHVVEQEDILSTTLGTKVEIREGNGRGRILIDFYSPDDFERLKRRLVAGTERG